MPKEKPGSGKSKALGYFLLFKGTFFAGLFFTDLVSTWLWNAELRTFGGGGQAAMAFSGFFAMLTTLAAIFFTCGIPVGHLARDPRPEKNAMIFPFCFDILRGASILKGVGMGKLDGMRDKASKLASTMFFIVDDFPQLLILAIYTSYIPTDKKPYPNTKMDGYALFSFIWFFKYVFGILGMLGNLVGLVKSYFSSFKQLIRACPVSCPTVLGGLCFFGFAMFFIVIPPIQYWSICINDAYGPGSTYCDPNDPFTTRIRLSLGKNMTGPPVNFTLIP